MRPLRLALAAGAALAAALPAPVHAATDVGYAVQFEGAGTYTYADRDEHGDIAWGQDVALRFAFDGDLGGEAVFRDGHLLDATGTELPAAVVTGTWTRRTPAGSSTCAGEDTAAASGWSRLANQFDDTIDAVPLDGEQHVFLRPFDRLDARWSCADDANFGWNLSLTGAGADDGAGDGPRAGAHPFDALFSIPEEAIGMGYVEQLVPVRTWEGEQCPSGGNAGVTECRLEWSGRITLRKMWERPVAAPDRPAAGPPETERTAPRVPPGAAKLDERASRASFRVSCPAGCRGTATLRPAGASTRASATAAAAAARTLARARFSVPAGRSRTVVLRLGRAARRTVRRAGGARLVVRTTSRGRTATTTLPLRLRRR